MSRRRLGAVALQSTKAAVSQPGARVRAPRASSAIAAAVGLRVRARRRPTGPPRGALRERARVVGQGAFFTASSPPPSTGAVCRCVGARGKQKRPPVELPCSPTRAAGWRPPRATPHRFAGGASRSPSHAVRRFPASGRRPGSARGQLVGRCLASSPGGAQAVGNREWSGQRGAHGVERRSRSPRRLRCGTSALTSRAGRQHRSPLRPASLLGGAPARCLRRAADSDPHAVPRPSRSRAARQSPRVGVGQSATGRVPPAPPPARHGGVHEPAVRSLTAPAPVVDQSAGGREAQSPARAGEQVAATAQTQVHAVCVSRAASAARTA